MEGHVLCDQLRLRFVTFLFLGILVFSGSCPDNSLRTRNVLMVEYDM